MWRENITKILIAVTSPGSGEASCPWICQFPELWPQWNPIVKEKLQSFKASPANMRRPPVVLLLWEKNHFVSYTMKSNAKVQPN